MATKLQLTTTTTTTTTATTTTTSLQLLQESLANANVKRATAVHV